jgi:hypothetical protein
LRNWVVTLDGMKVAEANSETMAHDIAKRLRRKISSGQ